MTTPTLTDPRQFEQPQHLREFFERVMRSNSTAPARPPFFKRLFFCGKKRSTSNVQRSTSNEGGAAR